MSAERGLLVSSQGKMGAAVVRAVRGACGSTSLPGLLPGMLDSESKAHLIGQDRSHVRGHWPGLLPGHSPLHERGPLPGHGILLAQAALSLAEKSKKEFGKELGKDFEKEFGKEFEKEV